jgi:hypothetical protein
MMGAKRGAVVYMKAAVPQLQRLVTRVRRQIATRQALRLFKYRPCAKTGIEVKIPDDARTHSERVTGRWQQSCSKAKCVSRTSFETINRSTAL